MRALIILFSLLLPVYGFGQISREMESINAICLWQLSPSLTGKEKIYVMDIKVLRALVFPVHYYLKQII